MATPAAPPSGAQGGPRLRGMPLWVWLVAGAVGLVVGLLLLRRQPAADGEEDTSGEGEEAAAQRGGGGGASAIPAPLLEAMGLTPPTLQEGGWEDGSGYVGYAEYSGSDQTSVGEPSTAQQETFYLQDSGARDYFAAQAQRTSPSFSPALANYTQPSTLQSIIYQQPSLAPAPAPEPSTAYTGGTLKAL